MSDISKDPEKWDALVESLTEDQEQQIRDLFQALSPTIKVLMRSFYGMLTDEQKALIREE